ncbi:RHS repeat-associated core domain-containing protein [Glaciecola sp. XM2]|uniref:RHS repeat-associated core domain-containing protein n=1 Tax=Glaciecola sp. XM2 TaxID=1914931 RepID=UPI00203224C2|nr:RHS repeat-associated core domain-containing protein [Glaciecola sp. XM2]
MRFWMPENDTGTNNEQTYTGHVYDEEFELNYMQARYYDPVIGRFYSNDPVGFTVTVAQTPSTAK